MIKYTVVPPMSILSRCCHFQDFKVSENYCLDLNRRCVCVNYCHNSNLNVLIDSKVTVRGLEIHTSIFPTPSNAKAAFIYQLSLFMLILQVKFCLFAQLFGLCCSWLPWSLKYFSEILYKGYSRHYLTTTSWSWGWEKKEGAKISLTLEFFMRTVTITSWYKIQCALKKRFSALFCIGSSQEEKRLTRKPVKCISCLQRPRFSFVSTMFNMLPRLNITKPHTLLLL